MPPRDTNAIISILAADRIGLIHDITRVISELGGDLADTRQQILEGYFSMILAAAFPKTISLDLVRERLSAIDPETPLTVTIHPAPAPEQDNSPPRATHVLTARGDDRIGFVALVSGFCARHGINILDLSTTGSGSTYTMILLVDLSACPDQQKMLDALEAFNREHGLNLLLQHHDIFRATNEIRMT